MKTPDNSTPLIIEVRANEGMPRESAPNVPYTPSELARDALECAEAGASVYHWHGRDAVSGATIDDTADFILTATSIRQRNRDLLLKPTTGFNRETAAARMAHIVAMAEKAGGLIDMIPLDNFSANSDVWDADRKRFTPGDDVYVNSRGHIMQCIGIARDLGLPVSLACPDMGSVRSGILYQEMGVLPRGILWELAFSGPALPISAAPGIVALQAMVASVPEGEPWSVLCTRGDLMPLVPVIILMGGHVSLGLGDHEYSRFGTPRNVDLVHRLVQMAETMGRPVATPAQAREILSCSAAA
jgi:3-keto-5-aminohexanoate cleavage enzyme